MRFIGDVDDDTARETALILTRVRRPPFEARIESVSSFGGNRPRALIVTLAPSPALLEMQAEQERLMQRVGLEPEGRKYAPHVTLARLRDVSSREVAEHLSSRGYFTPITFPVRRFVLYSSRASTGGGPYVIEQAYPLAA